MVKEYTRKKMIRVAKDSNEYHTKENLESSR
jgi:hypothetical protein